MTLWERIGEALSALVAGEPLSAVLERFRGTPERSVAFTIAVIALGAKIAKADGQVTRAEVATFRRIFAIAPEEEDNASHVYNLARQDVAGFDAYARKVAAMFPSGDAVLADLLEALFHIALSDGIYHEGEDDYLAEVAAIFGLDAHAFRMLKARFVEGTARDPWEVLGVSPAEGIGAARKAWRKAVRENHPDALVARGLPREAVKLAEGRMVDINAAWAQITRRRAA